MLVRMYVIFMVYYFSWQISRDNMALGVMIGYLFTVILIYRHYTRWSKKQKEIKEKVKTYIKAVESKSIEILGEKSSSFIIGYLAVDFERLLNPDISEFGEKLINKMINEYEEKQGQDGKG